MVAILCFLMCIFSSNVPTVTTLDPNVIGTKGTFNGGGLQFPPGDSLSVYYKYGKGSTIPTPALQSAPQSVTAISGTTPFPGFDVVDPCNEYSYQACAVDKTTNGPEICGAVKTFKTTGW